jgi:hypothetical protein
MSDTTNEPIYMGVFYREEVEDTSHGYLTDKTGGYFDLVATTNIDDLRLSVKTARSIDSAYSRDPDKKHYVGKIEFLITVDGKLAYQEGLNDQDMPAFKHFRYHFTCPPANCADITERYQISILVNEVDAELVKFNQAMEQERVNRIKATQEHNEQMEYERLKKKFQ